MTEQQNTNNFNINWILGILLALVVAGIILLPKENTQVNNEEKTETKMENASENITSPVKNH